MDRTQSAAVAQVAENDWVTFPGGELEGQRPKALCPACRTSLETGRLQARLPGGRGPRNEQRPLCFQCYRADLERQRVLRAAGDLDTASEARFQTQLPFEAVDRPRLDALKAARADVRSSSAGGYEDRRRRAQLAARHALRAIAANLHARGLSRRSTEDGKAERAERDRVWASAVNAAELQLPEAWLPFVVSR